MSFSIIGTGRGLPACIKKNEDLSKLVNTTDEWITVRTGIRQRHICTNETLTDVAYQAAVSAVKNAEIEANDIDLIICSTIRADHITPSLSCVLQERLGVSCPAFDINAACSGFIYALDVAEGYFARGRAEKILVVSAEAMSKLADWNDRSTCVLFGDGAGAVVLSKGDGLKAIKITAKGDTSLLRIPNTEGNCPFNKTENPDSYLYMNGSEVYKFAVSSMCRDVKDVMKEAGITQEDISYILPHQANIRIIDAAKSRLKVPKEKILINAYNYGNTSSASIPILLDEENHKGTFKKGDILVLSAFGGGLTTGACVLEWN